MSRTAHQVAALNVGRSSRVQSRTDSPTELARSASFSTAASAASVREIDSRLLLTTTSSATAYSSGAYDAASLSKRTITRPSRRMNSLASSFVIALNNRRPAPVA